MRCKLANQQYQILMFLSTLKYCTPLFLLVLFSIQCRPTRTNNSAEKQYKKIYVDQFKLTYLRKVLQTGFNQSESIRNVVKFDKSGFTEPILTEDDYHLIDSLAYIDNSQMMSDSIKRIGRVAEGAEGKHVFDFILNRFDSKWIDSIAKHRYKYSKQRSF